jgi:hypothetical protein
MVGLGSSPRASVLAEPRPSLCRRGTSAFSPSGAPTPSAAMMSPENGASERFRTRCSLGSCGSRCLGERKTSGGESLPESPGYNPTRFPESQGRNCPERRLPGAYQSKFLSIFG